MSRDDLPMDKVFLDGGAVCPMHTKPLYLESLRAGAIGGDSDAVIEIDMRCYDGRHSVLATLSITNGLINFEVRYRDWDPPVSI